MAVAATRTVLVVGSGSAGMRHLAALRALGIPAAVLPARAGRAAELSAGGWSVAKDARSSGASLAVIATDTKRHEADALAALAAGCDVLVEKPLAVDRAAGLKIAEAARAAGRKVFVGCVLRFSESLRQFRGWLPKLGALHRVSIECRSYLPDWRPDRDYKQTYSARADEGGVLRDLIHEVDYACWLFGAPAAVSGQLANLGRLGIEAEELAELRWTSPTGVHVSVGLDYLSYPPVRRMTSWGENGRLEWDGVAGRTSLTTREGSANASPEQTRDDLAAAQLEAFVAACSGGNPGPLATLDDGLAALAVCDAARRSSASGREEKSA